MAVYMESNNFDVERTGVKANVPDNDVARLMYYLNCVCVAIECNNDPDIQRFTSYHNWARLSFEEQKALIVVCYTFSPDILNDKVFFHSDVLCGERSNEFYTINNVRNQILAAESIVIAGQVRAVNKIMTYKMEWIRKYYLEPMRRLVARFNAPPTPPPITYRAPTNYQPRYTPPVISPAPARSNKCSCCCICCSIFIVILIIIGVGVGVFFLLKQKEII